MTRDSRPLPTDAELEILRVLWTRGPSTVRQVFEDLQTAKPVGYTTVLKFMQIMADKGLLRRNEDQRTHVYESVAPQESTQRQLVGDLLDRAFGGSASQLVMQALSARKASRAELDHIRELLDMYQEKHK
jgi:predicted transcriptional regulator